VYSQADIGFDTRVKKWFIQFLGNTRWFLNIHVISKNLELDNVIIDTYCWADTGDEQLTHGRFRFYENDTKIKGNITSNNIDDVFISSKDKVKLIKFIGIPTIWYNIKKMTWTIKIGKHELITRDIKGSLTGNISTEPRCFIGTKKVIIYHSELVSLIDVEIGGV
tara:strand:- start:102 stop:596 length:495 start_codon:yes stop_codon:yes gene_type:complete